MNQERDTVEIRNVGLPLAFSKPNLYIKSLISGLATLGTLILINTIFSVRVDFNVVVLSVLTVFFLWFYSSKYDDLYIWLKERKLFGIIPCAVIGFSNKVVILAGENVIEEIDTDEIEIRKLTAEEKQEYYNYTSAICAKKSGQVIKTVYVEGINVYEGSILNANPDRIEDYLEIIYD
jgi:hypothetical protein